MVDDAVGMLDEGLGVFRELEDDIFRVLDGKLVEHWTHPDFDALRMQMFPREYAGVWRY